MWALFVTMIKTAHPETNWMLATHGGLRMMACAAVLGLVVQRLTDRLPWPHPFRPAFAFIHLIAAAVYSGSWIVLNTLFEIAFRGHSAVTLGYAVGPFLVLGVWMYVMIAGISYAMSASERAARAEAAAAQSQLAALRGQLNPHFLFNALHTVVHLIPREPKRAAQAAEQMAGLLRTTIEEDRDVVSLADEWRFVEKYLDLERIRFGDRLRVHAAMTDDAQNALLPSFALQTLVENAVRHGAAPRVEPTDIHVSAQVSGRNLVVVVRDNGAGSNPAAAGAGSGLSRLRERLAALYGTNARLDIATGEGAGFAATLTLPVTE